MQNQLRDYYEEKDKDSLCKQHFSTTLFPCHHQICIVVLVVGRIWGHVLPETLCHWTTITPPPPPIYPPSHPTYPLILPFSSSFYPLHPSLPSPVLAISSSPSIYPAYHPFLPDRADVAIVNQCRVAGQMMMMITMIILMMITMIMMMMPLSISVTWRGRENEGWPATAAAQGRPGHKMIHFADKTGDRFC